MATDTSSRSARFADYLVAMHDGEIYDWGPPESVVTEELLADVFAVDAAVVRSSELQIVPKRALSDADGGTDGLSAASYSDELDGVSGDESPITEPA